MFYFSHLFLCGRESAYSTTRKRKDCCFFRNTFLCIYPSFVPSSVLIRVHPCLPYSPDCPVSVHRSNNMVCCEKEGSSWIFVFVLPFSACPVNSLLPVPLYSSICKRDNVISCTKQRMCITLMILCLFLSICLLFLLFSFRLLFFMCCGDDVLFSVVFSVWLCSFHAV